MFYDTYLREFSLYGDEVHILTAACFFIKGCGDSLFFVLLARLLFLKRSSGSLLNVRFCNQILRFWELVTGVSDYIG